MSEYDFEIEIDGDIPGPVLREAHVLFCSLCRLLGFHDPKIERMEDRYYFRAKRRGEEDSHPTA